MNKSFATILKGVICSCTNGKVITRNLNFSKGILAANNSFNFVNNTGRCLVLNKNVAFNFSSSQGHHHKHQHKHNHHHHHSADPIKEMRQQLQNISSQIQLKYPTQPQLVIKQLYERCQKLVGQNKKVQILMLFEMICQFIESKNLVQQYSSFLIMSAGNSFLMGKYQQVQRRCKLALPFQVKKHGEKHKNIGDIYNMLGISISKTLNGKGSEALEYLEKAFVIRKELHGQSGQAAEVLFNAGIIQQQAQKMFQRAQKNYLDAVQMLQNTPTPVPLLYIKTKMRLSQVQYKIHQVASKYISDMLRLLELIEKYKNDNKFQQNELATIQMFLSLLHRNLGKNFLQSNDYANAVKFFELCLNYLRENKMQTQDRIEVLESCAIAYTNMNEFTKAAQLLQQSQKIVASFPGVTDQYKFHMWKFLSQIYRKTSQPQKELNVLQKMRTLINETKEKFLQPLDFYQTDICLIYCLGNLKMFDKVIEVGKQSLKGLEKEKTLSVENLNDFTSNVAAYVGFAYLSKGEADTALQYFTKSDEIFTVSGSNLGRYDFHSNIMRKIANIYIQTKKNFIYGFQYLNKHRLHILNQKQLPLSKKLNDMVVLLLDYEIQTGENNETQIVQKLIQAKYIQRINEVIHEIVTICKQLSLNKQNKHILANYYILIDSIYQMLLSFDKIRDYTNKKSDLNRTKQLLMEMIHLYNGVFEKQSMQVFKGEYVGDEAMRVNIKKANIVKEQLSK